MTNSNIAGYDIEKDPFAPSLLHDITPEGEADITASASVDSTTGTPAVVVTRTKPSASTYNFNFAFSGIKGEQGLQGEQGIQGERGLRGLQGEQGVQGNPGVQGPQGIQGVGIAGISYIGDDASGNAVYRITLTNNATYDFTAYKGPQGKKGDQGLPGTGEDGVGISDISYTSTDANGNNIYTVTLSNNQTYTFTANRGPQGLPGNDGADGITPIISATASVDNTSGTPSVTVTKSGTDDAPAFNFAFTGLKGADGSVGSLELMTGSINFNFGLGDLLDNYGEYNLGPGRKTTLKAMDLVTLPLLGTTSKAIPAGSIVYLQFDGVTTNFLTLSSASISNVLAIPYLKGKAGAHITITNGTTYQKYSKLNLICSTTTYKATQTGVPLLTIGIEQQCIPILITNDIPENTVLYASISYDDFEIEALEGLAPSSISAAPYIYGKYDNQSHSATSNFTLAY